MTSDIVAFDDHGFTINMSTEQLNMTRSTNPWWQSRRAESVTTDRPIRWEDLVSVAHGGNVTTSGVYERLVDDQRALLMREAEAVEEGM